MPINGRGGQYDTGQSPSPHPGQDRRARSKEDFDTTGRTATMRRGTAGIYQNPNFFKFRLPLSYVLDILTDLPLRSAQDESRHESIL